MREGPDSGLDGYRKKGFRTGVSDSELEEYFRERRNTGKEEYRKGGIQERRNTGKEECRKGGIQERRNTGKEECRKGEMQESRVQDRRDAEQERC